ncbi:MAG: hypothetical protein Q4E71_04885 [Prevotella sp.]|nr:hypothetical protein [Prevotella sp.]
MKKLFLMAIAAVMSLGASAQLVSSNTLTNKASKNYSRLSVSYNSISMDKDWIDGGMNGFSLAWTKGISVSSSTPLFIETGLGATFAFKSDDNKYADVSHKFIGVTVPINLAYKWNISNTDINLIPFVGVYLRGNLYGNTNYSNDEYDIDEDTNWFDDYDDDGMEAARLSFGWNIGVGFEYSKLYVGLSYGSDFNEFIEKADKPGIFSATVGFNF